MKKILHKLILVALLACALVMGAVILTACDDLFGSGRPPSDICTDGCCESKYTCDCDSCQSEYCCERDFDCNDYDNGPPDDDCEYDCYCDDCQYVKDCDCGDCDDCDYNNGSIDAAPLRAPVNLTFCGGTLTWDEEPNAFEYSVYVQSPGDELPRMFYFVQGGAFVVWAGYVDWSIIGDHKFFVRAHPSLSAPQYAESPLSEPAIAASRLESVTGVNKLWLDVTANRLRWSDWATHIYYRQVVITRPDDTVRTVLIDNAETDYIELEDKDYRLAAGEWHFAVRTLVNKANPRHSFTAIGVDVFTHSEIVTLAKTIIHAERPQPIIDWVTISSVSWQSRPQTQFDITIETPNGAMFLEQSTWSNSIWINNIVSDVGFLVTLGRYTITIRARGGIDIVGETITLYSDSQSTVHTVDVIQNQLSAPQGLQLSQFHYDLVWEEVPNAPRYEIFLRRPNELEYAFFDTRSSPFRNIGGLNFFNETGTYHFRVMAMATDIIGDSIGRRISINDEGTVVTQWQDSAMSEPLSIQLWQSQRPDIPQHFISTNDDTQNIRIGWGIAPTDVPGGWEVAMRRPGNADFGILTDRPQSNNFAIDRDALLQGGPYEFKVRGAAVDRRLIHGIVEIWSASEWTGIMTVSHAGHTPSITGLMQAEALIERIAWHNTTHELGFLRWHNEIWIRLPNQNEFSLFDTGIQATHFDFGTDFLMINPIIEVKVRRLAHFIGADQMSVILFEWTDYSDVITITWPESIEVYYHELLVHWLEYNPLGLEHNFTIGSWAEWATSRAVAVIALNRFNPSHIREALLLAQSALKELVYIGNLVQAISDASTVFDIGGSNSQNIWTLASWTDFESAFEAAVAAHADPYITAVRVYAAVSRLIAAHISLTLYDA